MVPCQVPKVLGHGFNTFGLPGDPSPPSRFVKMFFERQIVLTNSPPKKKLEDAVSHEKFPILLKDLPKRCLEINKYIYIYTVYYKDCFLFLDII